MATQLAPTERPGKTLAKAPVIAGNAIRAFVPQTLEEAWRLSTAIAQSGMAPKSYGTDANKIMVGIMAGAEVGMTPFVALQSFANINGNPSLWGDGMLGLVEASGLLEDIAETDDGKEATCVVRRRGRPTEVVNTFSMEDAKVAGLLGKQGPWQTAPKRMRKLRARAFSLRDAFSDVLKGIKSAEEVRDYATMDGGMLGTGSSPQVITANMLADHSDDEPETGRTDEQHGDQFDGSEQAERTEAKDRTQIIADDIITRAKTATKPAQVENLTGVLDQHRATFTPAQIEACEVALVDAKGRV